MKRFDSWQAQHRFRMWLTRHKRIIKPVNYTLLVCSTVLFIISSVKAKVMLIRYATDLPINDQMFLSVTSYAAIGMLLYAVFVYIYKRI